MWLAHHRLSREGISSSTDKCKLSTLTLSTAHSSFEWYIVPLQGQKLQRLLIKVAPSLPDDMLNFLTAGDAAMQEAAKHINAAAHFAAADVVIEAPMKRPPKILAIGLNYRAHAEESNMEIPKYPVVITKQAASANGPYAPIHSPTETKMLD